MAKRKGKTTVLLYVEPDLKKELQMYASQEDRSLTNYISQLLKEHVMKKGECESCRERND